MMITVVVDFMLFVLAKESQTRLNGVCLKFEKRQNNSLRCSSEVAMKDSSRSLELE
jgi:hypothetical protein